MRLRLITPERALLYTRERPPRDKPVFIAYNSECSNCITPSIYQVGSIVDDSNHFRDDAGGVYGYPSLGALIEDPVQRGGPLVAFVAVMQPFGKHNEQSRIYANDLGPSAPFRYTRSERAYMLGIRVFANYLNGEDSEFNEGYVAEDTRFEHQRGILYPLSSESVNELKGQVVGYRLRYHFKIIEKGEILFSPLEEDSYGRKI